MTSSLSVDIASPPDRENLVAEVFVGVEQIFELNTESGELMLEVYPRQDGEPWRLSLDALMEALSNAKKRLVG